MAGDWVKRGARKENGPSYSRTLTWDEFQDFKTTGELPAPGAMPVDEPPLQWHKTTPRRPLIFAHHERVEGRPLERRKVVRFAGRKKRNLKKRHYGNPAQPMSWRSEESTVLFNFKTG